MDQGQWSVLLRTAPGAASRRQRSAPDRERAAELARAGKNITEIHEELGYSRTQNHDWLIAAGVSPARRRRYKPSVPPNLIDLTGRIVGELTVLRRATSSTNSPPMWCCVCSCGCEVNIEGRYLRGTTRWRKTSCGHAARGAVEFKIEHRPEYIIWANMRKSGAVSERWATFEQFFADMGPRPKDHVFTRLTEEPHGPGVSVYMLRYRLVESKDENEALSIAEWAERAGLTYSALAARLWRGWSLQRALGVPSRGSSMGAGVGRLREVESELLRRLGRGRDR